MSSSTLNGEVVDFGFGYPIGNWANNEVILSRKEKERTIDIGTVFLSEDSKSLKFILKGFFPVVSPDFPSLENAKNWLDEVAPKHNPEMTIPLKERELLKKAGIYAHHCTRRRVKVSLNFSSNDILIPFELKKLFAKAILVYWKSQRPLPKDFSDVTGVDFASLRVILDQKGPRNLDWYGLSIDLPSNRIEDYMGPCINQS